jgi:hypothetical protein
MSSVDVCAHCTAPWRLYSDPQNRSQALGPIAECNRLNSEASCENRMQPCVSMRVIDCFTPCQTSLATA